jgi:hypothetical protein
VNYFGHLVVAEWGRRGQNATRFAVGTMLPDWASMCGARVIADGAAIDRAGSDPSDGDPSDGGAEVRAGIAFHHATDRAFHALPAFRALEQRAIAALSARGLERGPVRGAAHVAVELALDGVLVARDPAACDLYLAALDEAPRHPAHHGGDPRMATLVARLVQYGLPLAYRDPVEVARRTALTLSRRPRLALDRRAHAELAAYLPDLIAAVEAAADGLLAALRVELAR